MIHYTYDEQMTGDIRYFLERVHTLKAFTPSQKADLAFLHIENHMRQMRREAQNTLYGTLTETWLGMPHELPHD